MPDDAENIGGISVSLGASNARLAADLAEANRMLDSWRRQRVDVSLGAVGGGGAAAPAAQARQSPIAQSIRQEAREVEQAGDVLVRATRGVRRKNLVALNDDEGAPQGIRRLPESVTSRAEQEAHRAQTARQRRGQAAYTQSESARRKDLTDTSRYFQTLSTLAETHFNAEYKRLDKVEGRRKAASFLNANPPTGTGGLPPSTTIFDPARDIASTAPRRTASNMTPEERQVASDRRQEASRRRQAAEVEVERVRAAQRRDAFDRANGPATQQAFAASARVRQYSVDEEQQARVIASRRAAATGASRTSRTLASSLGGLFVGTGQRQIEAQVVAQQAARQLASAEQAIAPLDQRLGELAKAWSHSTGEMREYNREQFRAIRRSGDYRAALGNVKKAIEEDATAQEKLDKISSGGSVVRNLAAITAAGAAFGLALKAVDFAIAVVTPAVANFVEIQTGFVGTSSRVTGAIAQQTAALHGNVDAALASAEAQAGLSATAASYLDTQLRLPAQIKAGAIAQQQASDLFRASQGGGGAATGLFGGYGGLLGSPLFGQQLGGGRGFSELVSEDLRALSTRRGKNPLENVGGALSYLTDTSTRNFINEQGAAQGSPLSAIGRVPGGVGDFASALNPFGKNFLRPFDSSNGPTLPAPRSLSGGGIPQLPQVTAYLNDLNKAAERGATAIGSATRVTYEQAASQEELARATAVAAQAGDVHGVTLAQEARIIVKVNGEVARSSEEYKKALEQVATGRSLIDPEILAKQFEFTRFATIRQADRQQAYSLETQLPARAALQRLAAPAPAIGTGIVAANADEQERITAGQQRSIELQDSLNTYYEKGKQVLIDTYKVPQQLVSQVSAIGAEIASVQASIRNDQAAYQVAQYNFQLRIARRSLSDIGGLTGKNFGAGQSYLGILERQNLALSRQGQLLQFALSQRQINFQVALAGFQAPGITPEERAARVEEAKIEASYAQKQLDIQKQMFGNQVQIVDISNLRQGADLAAQIGLLLQGRQVTIDTALAEERLIRLQAQQQILVEEVGTYLTRVDSLAAAAMGEIQQMEAAAGKALSAAGIQAITTVYGFYASLTNMFSGMLPGGDRGDKPMNVGPGYASGGIFDTMAPTRIGNGIMGEAGGETVAILSHPRALNGVDGSAGSNVSVNFNGDFYVRAEQDIDEITRRVTRSIGREASQRGLRSVG